MTRFVILVAAGLLAWPATAQAASMKGQSGDSLGGDSCCNDNLGGNDGKSDNGGMKERIRQLQRFLSGKDVRGGSGGSGSKGSSSAPANLGGGGDN